MCQLVLSSAVPAGQCRWVLDRGRPRWGWVLQCWQWGCQFRHPPSHQPSHHQQWGNWLCQSTEGEQSAKCHRQPAYCSHFHFQRPQYKGHEGESVEVEVTCLLRQLPAELAGKMKMTGSLRAQVGHPARSRTVLILLLLLLSFLQGAVKCKKKNNYHEQK